MIIYSIPLLFLAAAIIIGIARSLPAMRTSSLWFALVNTAAVFYLIGPYLFGSMRVYDDWFWLDPFSALIAVLVAFVYLLAILVAIRYLGHELEEGIISLREYRSFFVFFQLFALCMLVVPLSNNTMVLWLALEGTTLFSTFLVGLYRKKSSIEAAWKYMILCSTGISLGLVGVLLLGYGAFKAGIDSNEIFLLSSLLENAKLISPDILKLSFVFIFIGFGTKLGLFPMHAWLPDAHSKAPSPVSAIFSAVLLNVALYSILRFRAIVDASGIDPWWTANFFIVFGIASVIVSALMMLIQENYKRMLAYSSIEHMGLITLSFGLGPIGALFATIHMIGHTFYKSSLFFVAGEILLRFKTTKVANLSDVFASAKHSSILFIAGIVMIVAMPPSALLLSEFGIFSQLLTGYPKSALLLFVALGIIAYAMLSISIKMIYKKSDKNEKLNGEKWNFVHTIAAAEMTAMAILGIYLSSEAGLSLVSAISNTISR